MAWRKIRNSDIARGVLVRMTGMADEAFNAGVVLAVDETTGLVRIARPMAYAAEHYDSRSPMLLAETYEVCRKRMCDETSDFEVYEGRDGHIRMRVT